LIDYHVMPDASGQADVSSLTPYYQTRTRPVFFSDLEAPLGFPAKGDVANDASATKQSCDTVSKKFVFLIIRDYG